MIVRDWAGGIPPQVLPHIFDELFTTKGPGRGTGLGLWIARNLVEQAFGGTLTVDTTPEVGSVFIATLPLTGRESADDQGQKESSGHMLTPLCYSRLAR